MKKILLMSALVLILGAFVVGCGASKTDEEAVEDTIRDMMAAYNAENYDKCLTYLAGVTDEDVTKAALTLLQATMGDVTIDKIENVTVNGSNATADVTLKMGDQTDTTEMTFTKVDGKWKMAWEDIFSPE